MKLGLPIILSLACLVCSCRTGPKPETYDQRRSRLATELKAVTVEDGVDEAEANVIAQSYFLRFGPGCGYAADVTDGGPVWISAAHVGYAGVPTREPIRIDKRTGRVTWGNGPTVEDPHSIL
jgi:hypothetical protein